jgi:hypothetical protein
VIGQAEFREIDGFRGVHYLEDRAVVRLRIRFDDDALELVPRVVLQIRKRRFCIADRNDVRADFDLVVFIDDDDNLRRLNFVPVLW